MTDTIKRVVVCFSGFSGTGKDTCSDRIVERCSAVHIGLADPAKRHMADVYGFSEEQLFGPSKFRNFGVFKYPKPIMEGVDISDFRSGRQLCIEYPNIRGKIEEDKEYIVVTVSDFNCSTSVFADYPIVFKEGVQSICISTTDPRFFLSPREALQIYCETMNKLYQNTWIDKGINIIHELSKISHTGFDGRTSLTETTYSKFNGITKLSYCKEIKDNLFVACFSDFRHKHEINTMKQFHGLFRPIIVRVKRKGIEKPPFNHRSETEQTEIADNEFNYVINNDGTIKDLHEKVDHIIENDILAEPIAGRTYSVVL